MRILLVAMLLCACGDRPRGEADTWVPMAVDECVTPETLSYLGDPIDCWTAGQMCMQLAEPLPPSVELECRLLARVEMARRTLSWCDDPPEVPGRNEFTLDVEAAEEQAAGC